MLEFHLQTGKVRSLLRRIIVSVSPNGSTKAKKISENSKKSIFMYVYARELPVDDNQVDRDTGV